MKKANYIDQLNEGITLVALVITIIVLLVLTGITINLVLGENGIINKSKITKEESRGATVEEQVSLWKFDKDMSKYVNGVKETRDGIIERLRQENLLTDDEVRLLIDEEQDIITIGSREIDFSGNKIKKPTVSEVKEKPIQKISSQFSKNYGVIEIAWLDVNNNVIESPEAPILDELKAVKWDENGGNYTEVVADNYGDGWYNYEIQKGNTENGGSSRWANAKAINGVNEAYFVWIPRYAYKIIYFDTEANKNSYIESQENKDGIIGYSTVHGMIDITNDVKLVEGTEPINVTGIVKTSGYKDYIPHPAFEFGTFKTGLWVGKYEPSGTTSIIKIMPQVASLANLTVNDIFNNACKSVKRTYGLSGDTHMMKNTEWGAMAYLTESKYGRNGTEVANNNSSITGNSAGKPDATSSDPTSAYNTEQGILASTTGNIYGIYDTNGGKQEYMAAHTSSSSFCNIMTSADLKHRDRYVYSASIDTNSYNYAQNKGMRGDAIYETSLNWQTNWNGDTCMYSYQTYSVFARTKIVSFVASTGDKKSYISFRVVYTP